jgi:lysophospholipase L1-like esterase
LQFSTKKRNLLLSLLAFISVLLIFEGLARIGYTILQDIRLKNIISKQWYIYSSELGWERRPNFKGTLFRTEREFDSQGLISVDTLKKSDSRKTRVVFIGDSTTFGNRVQANSTFVEQLESLLPHINTTNLAVSGYTSYQGYKILLKYGLELNPDILVVSFNFNDRRFVLQKDDIDSDLKFQRAQKVYGQQNIRKFLKNLYLFRSMVILFKLIGLIEEDSKGDPGVKGIRLDTVYPRVSPENYKKNLVKIVELARTKNVSVIFLMLKDNPVQTELLKRGIKLLKKSQYNSAIENLKMTIQSNNVHSNLARIYLAKAYEENGLIEDSRDILILKNHFWSSLPLDSLHGGHPIYLDTDYNQIMRKVAEEYSVDLVDAGRVLDENPSYYYDFCHFDANGHRKVAQLLSMCISEMLSKIQ